MVSIQICSYCSLSWSPLYPMMLFTPEHCATWTLLLEKVHKLLLGTLVCYCSLLTSMGSPMCKNICKVYFLHNFLSLIFLVNRLKQKYSRMKIYKKCMYKKLQKYKKKLMLKSEPCLKVVLNAWYFVTLMKKTPQCLPTPLISKHLHVVWCQSPPICTAFPSIWFWRQVLRAAKL